MDKPMCSFKLEIFVVQNRTLQIIHIFAYKIGYNILFATQPLQKQQIKVKENEAMKPSSIYPNDPSFLQ